LVSTTGTHLLDRASQAVVDDRVLMWGGVAVLVLLIGWVLKPNR